MLCIDRRIIVSLLIRSEKRTRYGEIRWVISSIPEERCYSTLLCKLNPHHDFITDYYVFPSMDFFRRHESFENDPWLLNGTKLNSLSEFYETIKRVCGAPHPHFLLTLSLLIEPLADLPDGVRQFRDILQAESPRKPCGFSYEAVELRPVSRRQNVGTVNPIRLDV